MKIAPSPDSIGRGGRSNCAKVGALSSSSVCWLRWFGGLSGLFCLRWQTLAQPFKGTYGCCPLHYGGGPGQPGAERHHAQVRAGKTRPWSIASQSAIGIAAAEVLPYFSMLTKTFSDGRFSRFEAASMMRRFA